MCVNALHSNILLTMLIDIKYIGGVIIPGISRGVGPKLTSGHQALSDLLNYFPKEFYPF